MTVNSPEPGVGARDDVDKGPATPESGGWLVGGLTGSGLPNRRCSQASCSWEKGGALSRGFSVSPESRVGHIYKEWLSRSGCQGAVVKGRLSRSGCQGAVVKERLSRSGCQGAVVKEWLSRSGCQGGSSMQVLLKLASWSYQISYVCGRMWTFRSQAISTRILTGASTLSNLSNN